MALTRAQTRALAKARKIAEFIGIDPASLQREIEGQETSLIEMAINDMVTMEVVSSYTLLDQIMSTIVLRYFFGRRPRNLLRSKRFRVFKHYILEEMFLLKKLEVVNAIRPIPKNVRNILYRINALRNALAHSFEPEHRREFRKHGKVVYNEKNLRSIPGLTAFHEDAQIASKYLLSAAKLAGRTSYKEP